MKKLVSLLPLLLAVGCTNGIKGVVQEAAPAAVDSTIEQASMPENREKVASVLKEATIRAVVAGIEPTTVRDVLIALNDRENEQAIEGVVEKLSRAIAVQSTKPVPPEIKKKKDEVISNTARLAARAALDELKKGLPAVIREVSADPAVKEALQPISRAAASGAVKGAADTITGGD